VHTSSRGFIVISPTDIAQASGTPSFAASDNDAFFEYGYVWLPYAVAALVLLVLGAVAAVRWRRSSPGTAELLITSGALLAVLAAIVLGLADGASENNGLASIDPAVWQWMVEQRTPALTTLAIVVTEIGSTLSMSVIAGATVVYLLIKHRRGDAALVAVVAAGAGLLVRVGKATVGRERPPENFRLVTETNESFPSGHALASAAILGVILAVLVPSIRGRGARIAVLVGVGLFVMAIGLSRLYLGVHWTTDVIGGWVTGLAWLALCLTVRQVWRQTHGRPELLVSEPGPPAEPDRPPGTRGTSMDAQ
jgi:membrane-associated phospholipid phosphatase